MRNNTVEDVRELVITALAKANIKDKYVRGQEVFKICKRLNKVLLAHVVELDEGSHLPFSKMEEISKALSVMERVGIPLDEAVLFSLITRFWEDRKFVNWVKNVHGAFVPADRVYGYLVLKYPAEQRTLINAFCEQCSQMRMDYERELLSDVMSA